jgi:hypothetical protein
MKFLHNPHTPQRTRRVLLECVFLSSPAICATAAQMVLIFHRLNPSARRCTLSLSVSPCQPSPLSFLCVVLVSQVLLTKPVLVSIVTFWFYPGWQAALRFIGKGSVSSIQNFQFSFVPLAKFVFWLYRKFAWQVFWSVMLFVS